MKNKNNLKVAHSSWRFRLGLSMFVLAFASPLGAVIVAKTNLSVGLKAVLSGLFLAGLPEIFTVIAIALMGKAGFAYIKNYLLKLLKRYGPPMEVSKTRYNFGLVMLLVSSVLTWVLMYIPFTWVPGYPQYRVPINLVLDIIFFASFFVLGGDFWDKIYALFVHGAKADFGKTYSRRK